MRESILTVVIGVVVGTAIAALLLITGWTTVTASSALVALGYFAVMMAVRDMDRRRGRPVPGMGQILAGSIASGVAAMALPRIWELIMSF